MHPRCRFYSSPENRSGLMPSARSNENPISLRRLESESSETRRVTLPEIAAWKLTYLLQSSSYSSIKESLTILPAFNHWKHSLPKETVVFFQSYALPEQWLEMATDLLNGLESNEIVIDSSSSLTDSILTAKHALKEACHALIRKEVDAMRFDEAVEAACRRSTYNLAYGLSHEINNPLANISARAQMLLAQSTNSLDQKSLATIIDQAQRAHEMLAELMISVQSPRIRISRVELVGLVQSVRSEFAGGIQSRGIEIAMETDLRDTWLESDESMLKEAVRALLRNSVEACRPGDTICIRIWKPCDEIAKIEGCVAIEILDNGPGMSPETLAKAWDFYFSGREAGRGLGLGLSKVKRLIENCQGKISINSALNQGCKVTIELPVKRSELNDAETSSHR